MVSLRLHMFTYPDPQWLHMACSPPLSCLSTAYLIPMDEFRPHSEAHWDAQLRATRRTRWVTYTYYLLLLTLISSIIDEDQD